MSVSWAVVDGVGSPLDEATIPVTDLGFKRGWAVFDTMAAVDGELVDPERHIRRLAESAREALIEMPDAAVVRRELEEAARHVPGRVAVRVTLTGSGHRVVTAEPIPGPRLHGPVRAARGTHRDDPYIAGSVKGCSRAGWMVAVERDGVDEVLLVDSDGRFTEGTTCGIVASIGGVLWTAPHDGRILASTTVQRLLERAGELGIEVRREGPPASGPWDALYAASTTRHIAPIVELDGERLPGWDPVGRRLAGLDP